MKLIKAGQALYNLDAVRWFTYSVVGPPWKQEFQLWLHFGRGIDEHVTITGPGAEKLYQWLTEQVAFNLTEDEEEQVGP